MNAQEPLSLSPENDLASLCKAAGDNLRLEILRALARDSYGVLELAQAFAIKQSLMSHHLKTLSQAGFISSRREGNSIFYRRAPLTQQDFFADFKTSLFNSLDKTAISAEVQARLQSIHRERAATAKAFFVDNAAKFRAQQDLIASYSAYGAAVSQLVLASPEPRGTALEVGPGEGEFLAVLGSVFRQVVALDTSEAMLKKAEEFVDTQGLDNIAFLLGDTSLLQNYPVNFNCAVINMVLHHVPSPAQLLLEVAASLVPGGQLIITDLCRHEQHWAKEACGDLWMGFATEDILTWADSAGLSLAQSSYLALRNGFQIQIHQLKKAH